MNIPNKLKSWNYAIIREMVDRNIFESDRFDFKPRLPKRQELEKIVCAFANGNGGFLILGVRDITTESPRIVGFSDKKDLINDFNNRIKRIEPAVLNFKFKQPAIRIPEAKEVIHVIFIHQSNDKPHITSEGLFLIRRNGANDIMTYNEVRESFWGYEKRKINIEMLGIELAYFLYKLKKIALPSNENSTQIATLKFDLFTFNQLFASIFPIISKNREIVLDLQAIRIIVETINSEMDVVLRIRTQLVRKNQEGIRTIENIRKNASSGCNLIKRTLESLTERYGLDFSSLHQK